MKDDINNRKITDAMYEANYDFTGMVIENSQEIVSFKTDMSIRIWYNDLAADFSTHWHNALEIIMVEENYYDVRVGTTLYHLMPGEILFIPPGELHSLQAPSDGKRFIFLFDISFLSRLKGFYGIQSMLIQPLYLTKKTYMSTHDDIYRSLQQIKVEYFKKREYSELSIYASLINIFVQLGYHRLNAENPFPNVRSYKQKEYVQKFNTLLEYINSHYMEDLNLETVANSIGFSKYHFIRLFKQYTGFTFCDYINYKRIKIAEELLEKPDCSITEVALQAGFPSISTFNRLFKQQKNCTPSEYRAQKSKSDF